MDEEDKITYNEEAIDDLIRQRSFKSTKLGFKDSGWVLLYVICGLICVFVGFLLLSAGNYIAFCSALLASLSCFFAAHVLRLQEKTAHHAERTAHHAEKNSELLRSINKKLKD